jgi:hypothetical protein
MIGGRSRATKDFEPDMGARLLRAVADACAARAVRLGRASW